MRRFSFPLVPALALAGVLLAAGLALAGPNGAGGGMGAGKGGGFGAFYSQLSLEQRAAVDAVFARHEQALFDLRQELWARNTELSALMDSGQADEKSVRALTTQIVDLRARQNAELKALREEIAKEAGVTLPPRGMGGACLGEGPGPGAGGGHGHGRGQGHGAGRGQGGWSSGETPNCPVLGGQAQ